MIDARERATGWRPPTAPPRCLRLAGWRADFGRTGELWLQVLVETGGLRADSRVLDVGCGPGRIAAPLTGYLDQGTYDGLDIVPESIAWCRRRIARHHPSFRFTLLDVQNERYNASGSQAASSSVFPYPDGVFDIAVATSLFTHMQPLEIERYLNEAARVLAPGGRLLSTYFLLTEDAERFVTEREDKDGLAFELIDGSGRSYRASSPYTPEDRIAVREADALELHAAAGLRIERIELGSWAGRPRPRRRQDLIVAAKPIEAPSPV